MTKLTALSIINRHDLPLVTSHHDVFEAVEQLGLSGVLPVANTDDSARQCRANAPSSAFRNLEPSSLVLNSGRF